MGPTVEVCEVPMSSRRSKYECLPILEETGYVVLSRDDEVIDPQEWLSLEFVDWKSSGDTRFAPLASVSGGIECNAFWHFDPPRTDKEGVWIESQVEVAPTIAAKAREPEAVVGRVRIIELQPNSYADALYNSHLDDNNRLNPEGEGWVVRAFQNLTDDATSYMVLREDIKDPSTETRIALPAGARIIVDSERMWHSVWHDGDEPRYCLITSFESGPALEKWIFANDPVTEVDSPELDPEVAEAAEREAQERRAARTAFYGYDPTTVMSEA
jgi:hypothetical protein